MADRAGRVHLHTREAVGRTDGPTLEHPAGVADGRAEG
jgi:hypothetical protein